MIRNLLEKTGNRITTVCVCVCTFSISMTNCAMTRDKNDKYMCQCESTTLFILDTFVRVMNAHELHFILIIIRNIYSIIDIKELSMYFSYSISLMYVNSYYMYYVYYIYYMYICMYTCAFDIIIVRRQE